MTRVQFARRLGVSRETVRRLDMVGPAVTRALRATAGSGRNRRGGKGIERRGSAHGWMMRLLAGIGRYGV